MRQKVYNLCQIIVFALQLGFLNRKLQMFEARGCYAMHRMYFVSLYLTHEKKKYQTHSLKTKICINRNKHERIHKI